MARGADIFTPRAWSGPWAATLTRVLKGGNNPKEPLQDISIKTCLCVTFCDWIKVKPDKSTFQDCLTHTGHIYCPMLNPDRGLWLAENIWTCPKAGCRVWAGLHYREHRWTTLETKIYICVSIQRLVLSNENLLEFKWAWSLKCLFVF